MKLRWFCAAILLSAANLFAQETATAEKPAAAPASLAVPSFKAGAQMVMVPVVVTGESGKHVSGLTKDAFRIEEDGKVREVAVFEEITPGKLTAPPAESKPSVSAAAPTASNVSLNNANSNHFTIVMLDLINTPVLKQTEGRQHLIDFLTKGLTPDEPVTLLGLGSKGIVQLHSFTTDTRLLIAALEKANSQVSSTEMTTLEQQEETDQNADWMNSITAPTEVAQQIVQFMQDAIDTQAALQQRDTTRQTLDALKQVAQAFAGNRDRKTLIWASAGFPFMINDPRAFTHLGTDMAPLYEQTWKALNAANIAVYPVELVGLDSRSVDASQHGYSNMQRAAHSGRGSSTANPMGTNGALAYDDNYQRQETLKAFADATGGKPCLNSNDFKKCYGDAIEDSQSYYMLGYYLPSDPGKPGWRKLKVRVSALDTHVRAREGFFVAPPADDSPATRRDEVLTALSSPFEYTGVVMDVKSSSSAAVAAKDGAKAAEPQRVMQDFIVHVPSSSIVIDPQNKNRVNLEIAAVALDKKGRDVSRFSQTVQVSFNPEMLARILKTGIALKEQLELIPGNYECRFIVRDNQSGQIGTVHMPFELK
jgi:VWFA-related protein